MSKDDREMQKMMLEYYRQKIITSKDKKVSKYKVKTLGKHPLSK